MIRIEYNEINAIFELLEKYFSFLGSKVLFNSVRFELLEKYFSFLDSKVLFNSVSNYPFCYIKYI